jgi:hypothetical protein
MKSSVEDTWWGEHLPSEVLLTKEGPREPSTSFGAPSRLAALSETAGSRISTWIFPRKPGCPLQSGTNRSGNKLVSFESFTGLLF